MEALRDRHGYAIQAPSIGSNGHIRWRDDGFESDKVALIVAQHLPFNATLNPEINEPERHSRELFRVLY